MVDISPGGFKLTSQYQIPLGKDFHLGLITTPDIADIEFVGFVARSIWCQTNIHDINQSQYYAGFEFINIAPHDAKIIERIMEKYGARDLSIM
jgi:c-di-GMP-binding flagellar brake protein YcgR